MMKSFWAIAICTCFLALGCTENQVKEKETTVSESAMKIYDIPVKTLSGEDFDWKKVAGKRLMIVNVASECGLTPQYEPLQAMYADLDTSKYAIIGVPANNFLKQEPGGADQIAAFCQKNYGVQFPILEKMNVCDKVYLSYPPKAEEAEAVVTSPLYAFLTQKKVNGNMDIEMKWNFQKIFVNQNGEVYDFADPSEIDPFVLLNKLAFTN